VLDADAEESFLGGTLAALGDADGDGASEFLVGAFGRASGRGRVLVARPHAGEPLACRDGQHAGELAGLALAPLGDLDGDGAPEWIVGAPGARPHGERSGAVRIYSGRSGRLLCGFDGEAANDEFGAAVAGVADFDLDGKPDFLVGAPGTSRKGYQLGRAALYSGATLTVARLWGGDAGEDRFGSVVADLGDVDADGHGDVAISGQQVLGPRPGYVRVYSGIDGLLIGLYGGEQPGDAFGSAIASLDDVDGDGKGELAIGAYLASEHAPGAGEVRLISVRDGKIVWRLQGERAGDALGSALAALADLDGDGVRELAIGAPRTGRGAGRVLVVSGKSGARLFALDGPRPFDRFGAALAGSHGFAGPVLAVGAPDHGERFARGGRVYVFDLPRAVAAVR
jgi:hypothetical protein